MATAVLFQTLLIVSTTLLSCNGQTPNTTMEDGSGSAANMSESSTPVPTTTSSTHVPNNIATTMVTPSDTSMVTTTASDDGSGQSMMLQPSLTISSVNTSTPTQTPNVTSSTVSNSTTAILSTTPSDTPSDTTLTAIPSTTISSTTLVEPSSTALVEPSSTALVEPTSTRLPSSTTSPPSTTTSTSVAVFTTPSRSVTAAPPASPVAAISGVLVVFAVIATIISALIVVFVIWMRRRKSKRSYELDHLLEGTDGTELKELSFKPSCKVNLDALFAHIPVTEAVLMTDLEQHMAIMESEEGKEFYTVQENDSEDFPIIAAKTSANFDKNRYINILPYDQTRVLLVELPRMPGSNYINANYVAGYNSKTEYIATQGPIAATIPDFWRMIWEQGTRNIVMVTSPVEGGITKCEVYWPRDGTAQKYGVVSVTNTQETIIPTCTIRKFTLAVAHNTKDQKQRQVMTREVNQFCYTGWPDMGVPNDASTMLKFVHRVRSSAQSDDGPIVVHCSAGVGRTGTYIAIDVQLQRMRQEGNVNVQQFVMQMRAQRSSMVQTEPQYMFIYKAILYGYMYGITELKKDEIKKHIEKLQLAFPNTEDSRLDIEYCGAVEVPDPDDEDLSVAHDPTNADKNRKTGFLPFNENRLTLSDPESTGNDYINASFVGVLGRTKEYIIAEHPLPSIVPAYWKMILDRGINTIVIIGPINDDEEVYWPLDEDPIEHNGITIKLLEHESEKGLSATMVEVECEVREQHINVSILQLNSWPCDSGEVPPSTDGMVHLLGLVSQHTSGRILVHSSCSLEDDASGVFCIVNSLAKRLKDDKPVDVMKTTTHLLSQRSNVIVSKDQYFFIYETLQEVISE